MRITKKLLRFTFDNQWKRGVAKYYLGIFSLVLSRDNQSVVTKASYGPTEIVYKRGMLYRLELIIVGLSFNVMWYRALKDAVIHGA